MPDLRKPDVDQRLAQILACPGETLEKRIRHALRHVSEQLGLQAALICRITKGACLAVYSFPEGALSPEQRFALQGGYDSLTANSGEVVMADKAPLAHPCSELLGPACMGIPLEGTSERYGTLDFFGDPEELPSEGRRLIRLLGTWAGEALSTTAPGGVQERSRDEKHTFAERLRDLHELATSIQPDLESRLNTYLGAGCRMFNMNVGVINQPEGDFCYVYDSQSGSTSRSSRFCDITIDERSTVAIADAAYSNDAWNHPMYREEGVASYIGTALTVGNEFFGVLYFVADRPHPTPWTEADRETIELMAEGIGLFLDVHRAEEERRRASEALRNSKALLASVLDNATDGIMALAPVKDEEGRIVDFEWLLTNPKVTEIFGHSEEELDGSRIRKELPYVYEVGLFRAFVQVLESGEPYRNELYYEGDGIDRWFQVTVVPFGDGIAVTLHDVTASKEVEQALRHSEERYRLLAENSTDIIARLHPEQGYTYVSPASHALLGYTPQEMIEHGQEYVHPSDLMRVQANYERVLDTGEPSRLTYRYRHKDGYYVWMETIARGVKGSEGGGVEEIIAVMREVTERVKAEEALRHTNRQLKEHNQALQDFAYVASHDLQEPLRKVRTFASLLEDEFAEAVDETGRHYLDRICDAATRMSGLITDLLEFSRVTTKEHPFENVNLDDVLREVIVDLEIAIAEADAKVEVDDLPTLEADGTQMRQLFQNLVSNAIKFVPEGESPVVQVRAELQEQGDSPRYRIHVEDNGIGFDEKYLDRIFTPFKRLHGRSAYEGTGMGLAICKRIVNRHGGDITASSKEGAGSSFTVILPRYQHRESTPETETTVA